MLYLTYVIRSAGENFDVRIHTYIYLKSQLNTTESQLRSLSSLADIKKNLSTNSTDHAIGDKWHSLKQLVYLSVLPHAILTVILVLLIPNSSYPPITHYKNWFLEVAYFTTFSCTKFCFLCVAACVLLFVIDYFTAVCSLAMPNFITLLVTIVHIIFYHE